MRTGAPEGLTAPSGVVTFLFTDVEGSTQLWAADRMAMSASLVAHDECLRRVFEAADGFVFTTAGDSFSVAFSRASLAVEAARAAQEALAAIDWPGPTLRVRIGIHMGEAEERRNDYFGPVVNLAARLEAAGHGGQILITDHVRAAAEVDAIDIGTHRLRDVPDPVQIFQVGEGDFPPLRIVNQQRSNVPTTSTRLIGRDRALGETRTALLEHRLVTLTAGGGTGKTRLALAVAEAELVRWPDGVWFVDLTSVEADAQVALAIADGVDLTLGAGDPTAQVIEFLAVNELLLVLDNCEHLVDACADLCEAMLERPGRSRVLATSREFFDVDGERAIRLTPLAADGIESAAVQLFCERATSVNPDLELDEAAMADVVALCSRLDGSPLAIELAAARSNVMTPTELLAGIGKRFELLRGGRRRRSKRTLEDTLDWSYDLLDDDEQRMFRSLGVFSGGFDAEAAAAVAGLRRGVALDLLDSLIAKSLVVTEQHAGSARFRLLETTAAYVENALLEAGEADTARTRHFEHYHARAGAHAVAFVANEEALELVPDRANLRAAVEWGVQESRWDDTARIVCGAWTVLRAQPDALLATARTCLEHLESPPVSIEAWDGVSVPHHITMRHLSIYMALTGFSDFNRAWELRAELESTEHPVAPILAHIWFAFGSVYMDADAGFAALREADGLASALPDGEVRAQLVGINAAFTGFALVFNRQYERGIERLQFALSTRSGLRAKPAWVELALRTCGVAHLALSQWDEAEAVADDLEATGGSAIDLRLPLAMARQQVEEGQALLRAHARDASTGRTPRRANDTMIMFAIEALALGDTARASVLLLQVGVAQSPATSTLSFSLADRLGLRSEFDQHRDDATSDPMGHSRRALTHVRAEIEARGW